MNQPFKSRVLITDGSWRKSLSAVRSLGKAGYHVTVMGDSLFTTSFWSRFTQHRITAPLASSDPGEFGRILLQALEKSPETTLLPMEDATLNWVGENLEKLKKLNCHVLIPPWESIQTAQDKGKTLAIAKTLKIPIPQTWKPESAHEFAEILKEMTPGEFIVKPRTSTGSVGFTHLADKKAHEWKAHWKKYGPMLIQDRIPSHGNAYGVSLLMDQDGECIAAFTHRRRHQYPLLGGPSTDRQSVHRPELVNSSIRLLKHLKWRGIAMVEWKTDPRDKLDKLMEINPRFWGSLELAVRAGVDFPKLYVRSALGEKVQSMPDYPAGIRCRWLVPGELLRYMSQTRMERESLRRFLSGLPGSAEEWDSSDPDGFAASLICTSFKAFLPQFWRNLRKE